MANSIGRCKECGRLLSLYRTSGKLYPHKRPMLLNAGDVEQGVSIVYCIGSLELPMKEFTP